MYQIFKCKRFITRRSIIAGVCSLLFFCSFQIAAQTAAVSNDTESSQISSERLNELLSRYPAGSIQTSEQANRAGTDVHEIHRIIEAQFANEQKICFPKFFATACLSDAKERHRNAAARVRAIEIEVNKFKRRDNVLTREKTMEEKRHKDSAGQLNQAKENPQQITDHPAESAPDLSRIVPNTENRIKVADTRVKKHELEVNRREAAEAEDAKKRAGNIAAYEKKQQESEARQREIAAKKLEKAREKSVKEAQQQK